MHDFGVLLNNHSQAVAAIQAALAPVRAALKAAGLQVSGRIDIGPTSVALEIGRMGCCHALELSLAELAAGDHEKMIARALALAALPEVSEVPELAEVDAGVGAERPGRQDMAPTHSCIVESGYDRLAILGFRPPAVAIMLMALPEHVVVAPAPQEHFGPGPYRGIAAVLPTVAAAELYAELAQYLCRKGAENVAYENSVFIGQWRLPDGKSLLVVLDTSMSDVVSFVAELRLRELKATGLELTYHASRRFTGESLLRLKKSPLAAAAMACSC